MLTIGICNDETSSACLFKNGELIAAVSEERFSRKKMDNSFPIMSIKYLLSLTEKKLEEINIAYSWAKGFNPELIKYYFQRYDLCLEGNDKNIFKERINHDIKRDQKGLYSAFERGEINNVVGLDLNFEEPKKPNLIIENNSSKTIFLKSAKEISNLFF